MAMITPAFLQSMQVNFDYRFQAALQQAQAQSFWNQVATEVPSTSRANHYPLVASLPGQLRKWVGERVKQGGAIFDYVINNDKYEGTISLEREDVEDSQFSMATLSVDAIAQETALWPDRLVTAIIESGATNTTWDGQPYFSGAHPIDPANVNAGVQANLFSSATAAGTRPLNAANFQYVLTASQSLKQPNGSPMGLYRRPTLMVPTALQWTARTILNPGTIAPAVAIGGNVASVAQSNILAGAADLLVNPWLTSSTAWYLLNTGSALKPYIFQRRTQPEFVWKNQPTDSNVFWQDSYDYGVRVRGNAGYSLWFMAAKADV